MKLWLKSLLFAIGLLFGGALLASASGCNPFVVATGGTGDCSFVANTVLIGNGTGAIATTTAGTNGFVLALSGGVPTWVATSSINNGVTSVATTYPVTGGPITTTGTIALAFGTTTSNTWAGTQTFTNAPIFSSLTGCLTGNGSSAITAGGTCATFGYPWTYTTNFGQTVAGTSTAIWLQASPISFMASSTSYFSGLNAVNATTTGSQTIPALATLTTPLAGNIGIDTTSGQERYSDVSGTVRVLVPKQYPVVTYATTTAFVGTTTPTIQLGTSVIAETWVSIQCRTDAGTVDAQFYNGTNKVLPMVIASTTEGTNPVTSNASFAAGTKRSVDFGTPASSPTSITCTIVKSYDPD